MAGLGFAETAWTPEATDAAASAVGLVRSANEDAFLRRPDARLWAVADGMGGHEEGEWASAAVVQALDAATVAGDFETDCARVADAIRAANAAIHDRAKARRIRMGSTVVALLVGDGRFAVSWAGDSRAYLLRDGELTQLTADHTQVQLKVARGLLTAEEARVHPMAHVLTRAVGAEAELDVATAHGTVQADDIFLLCSDGLHGPASDAEIRERLTSQSPAESCEALLALAHAGGAPDNVTVVVVQAS